MATALLPLALAALAATAPRADSVPIVAAFAESDRLVLLDAKDHIRYAHPAPLNNCDSVALSPGGERLAYTSYNEATGFQELFVADGPDFSRGIRVGPTSGWVRDPTWSPDGHKLAFALHVNSRWRPGTGRTRAKLFEEDLSTMEIRALSVNPMCHHFPAYADASGDSMLFVRTDCETSWNIARLDLHTGKEEQLTYGRARDHQPVASPDGHEMAYAHLLSSTAEIRVADADGSHARVVARVAHAVVPQLRWAPDGKALLWFNDGLIWRQRLDRTRPQVIRGSS